MSPDGIAEKMITMTHAPNEASAEIWSLLYRWHYHSDRPDRPGAEGAYGTKAQVEFFLSTQHQFVADLVREVLWDCMTIIEATEVSGSPDEIHRRLITAVKKQFEILEQ